MGLKNFLSHLIEDDSRHPEPEAEPGVVPPPAGERRAASSLGKVLRVLADSSPVEEGQDQLREKFDRLAKEAEREDPKALSDAPEHVERQRRLEREWIEESVRSLADGVLGVLRRLGRTAGDDRAEGLRIGEHLDGLRASAGGESLETLRRDVLDAVRTISQALRSRQDRQDREMAVISGQLERLKGELVQVRKQATLDGLTRLANRASLDEHLEASLALHRITGRPTCLLMVDVDRFKDLNDRLGHLAGDAVLRALSDTLAKSFPRKTDFVARYGGEEFAVVLSEDGADVGLRLAGRLVDAVRELRVPWDGEEIASTVSVGVASPEEEDAVEDWVARSDRKLYEAKRTGRDRVV